MRSEGSGAEGGSSPGCEAPRTRVPAPGLGGGVFSRTDVSFVQAPASGLEGVHSLPGRGGKWPETVGEDAVLRLGGRGEGAEEGSV